jgi:hypothetical protein
VLLESVCTIRFHRETYWVLVLSGKPALDLFDVTGVACMQGMYVCMYVCLYVHTTVLHRRFWALCIGLGCIVLIFERRMLKLP